MSDYPYPDCGCSICRDARKPPKQRRNELIFFVIWQTVMIIAFVAWVLSPLPLWLAWLV